MTNTSFFILFLLLAQGILQAQKLSIKDASSGLPIDHVTITNKGNTKTLITDFKGSVDLSAFGHRELLFISHFNYEIIRITKAKILSKGNVIYLTQKPQQLDEVVMSISKWQQQRRDIPQRVESIKAKTIAFNNPQTSADLLQSSGQVYVQKSQLGGGSPMIRGFATNRVLLSVDGVRMNNAIFRGGNLQNVISIDPFTIKNTEVLFGPGSVIYGSDAIGGVMNFYTKSPRFSHSDSLTFSGNASYRFSSANNENTGHLDFNFGHRSWASYTSFSYNNFGDLVMGSHGPESYLRQQYVKRINGEDVLVENTNSKKQVPSGYDQINFLQKIKYKLDNKTLFDLGLYYSETSDYARYDRLIRPNSNNDGLRSAEWFYGPQKWFMANGQMTKKGRSEFFHRAKITAAYQFFEESRHNRNFGSAMRKSTVEKVDALTMNVDFEHKRLGAIRMYYGAEYIFNKINSKGVQSNIETGTLKAIASRYPDGATWQTFAGYWNGEYRYRPNVTLLSGIRYSQVWIDANIENTFFQFPFTETDLITGALTGSLGLSWFPRENLQITLNGSTGFRAPNIDDTGKIFDSEPGSVVVPNPDLEPEYAYNVDFGLRKNFNDKLVLKASAYYTHLVDALVRSDFSFGGQTEIEYQGETSNVQAIQNGAKAYVYGFEFGMEAFFSKNFSLLGNLNLTEGTEEDANGESSPARHAAPAFADGHLIYKKDRFKADFFMNYNGEVSFEDLARSEKSKTFIYQADENGNPFSPSWYTLNFRSQYEISNALGLNIALENLTDQRYRTYSSGIAAPGINFILAVKYDF